MQSPRPLIPVALPVASLVAISVLLPILLLMAAAAHAQEAVQVIDAHFSGGHETISFETLAANVSLGPEENLKVIEVGRDEHTSHHAAAIRHTELPHVHEHYDIVVVLLRGNGKMLIGDSVKDVAQGSVFYVPRGIAHAFKNTHSDPAIAYVIYSPPFEGTAGPEE